MPTAQQMLETFTLVFKSRFLAFSMRIFVRYSYGGYPVYSLNTFIKYDLLIQHFSASMSSDISFIYDVFKKSIAGAILSFKTDLFFEAVLSVDLEISDNRSNK